MICCLSCCTRSAARLPHHNAIASPHQSEHTLNLNKLHEYFVFVKELVTALVAEEEPNSVTMARAADLLLMVVMECPLTLGIVAKTKGCVCVF